MANIIGGLALFVALGALILAGTALSRIEKQFSEMIHTQINPLRDRIIDLENLLSDLRKGYAKLDVESANHKRVQTDTFQALMQMQGALEKLSNAVTDLSAQDAARHGHKRKVGT
ncbi:MAG: hypothetical protein RIB59_15160 [Rhodospirillales bacterium]